MSEEGGRSSATPDPDTVSGPGRRARRRRGAIAAAAVALVLGLGTWGTWQLVSRTSPPTQVAEPTTDPTTPVPTGDTTSDRSWDVTAAVGDDQITVEGVGPADMAARVAVCLDEVRTSRDSLLCDLPVAADITTGADGSFTASLPATPYIGVGQRREVDCREESCTVAVVGADVVGHQTGSLDWSTTRAADVATSELRLTDLVLDQDTDTGSVTIQGSGFTPRSEVAIVQCPASDDGGVDAGDCLYQDADITAVADDAGEIDLQIAVYPAFQSSSGDDVTCDGSASTACVIGDPWPAPGSGNRYVMVPLTDDR